MEFDMVIIDDYILFQNISKQDNKSIIIVYLSKGNVCLRCNYRGVSQKEIDRAISQLDECIKHNRTTNEPSEAISLVTILFLVDHIIFSKEKE